MAEILWTPDSAILKNSQMNTFRLFVNEKFRIHLRNYKDLHNWSVREIPGFWESAWEYFEVIYSQPYTQIVDDTKKVTVTNDGRLITNKSDYEKSLDKSFNSLCHLS